jgi:hypothetical protein
MKALPVLLLCATPLLSQYVPPRVETGSRVPSVTVVPAGVDGTNYEFLVRNRSAHAITALDLLVVPHGVPKKDGQFECKNHCSDDPKIGTIDRPVIAAGGELKVKYETAKVSRGAVIAQAAIFDNSTYGGDEQSSTLLIAIQLGNQNEFDRIISAVRSFVADEDYDSEKGAEIKVALTSLPVDADSETIAAFGRWFPNIRDCSHRFPRIMQEASTEERTDVIKTLQPLLRTGSPSNAALTAWWSATQDYMSAFGCPQCGARMANPRTPAVQGTISFGCTQQALKHKTQPEDHSGSDNGNDDSADQTGAGDANSEYAGDRSTNENLRPAAESAKQRSTDSFGPFPAQPTTTVYPPDRSRALPADSSVNSTESVPSSAVPSPTAAQPSSVPPASTAPRGSMLGVFFTNGRRSAIAIMLVMVAAIVLVAVRALKTL